MCGRCSSLLPYSSTDLVLLETFLSSRRSCTIQNQRIAISFWCNIALSYVTLFHRWAPHKVSFQPPSPITCWQFAFSSSFPFDTWLEKISSCRSFLYTIDEGENHIQAVSWQFIGRKTGAKTRREWRHFSYYNCSITLAVHQIMWFLLPMQEIPI